VISTERLTSLRGMRGDDHVWLSGRGPRGAIGTCGAKAGVGSIGPSAASDADPTGISRCVVRGVLVALLGRAGCGAERSSARLSGLPREPPATGCATRPCGKT
jgi:hypothetical protein